MREFSLSKIVCIVFVFCAAGVIASPAQTLTTLVNFDWANGANPQSSLTQGTDGNFYGTTQNGGAYTRGTVFKITPSGALTTLYSFCSQSSCMDGLFPFAGLVQATDGNFYGTTADGGTYDDGTVFKITPGGTLTTLHSFQATDGADPQARLVQATDGNFYGTTVEGGTSNNCGSYGCGTVFKITPSGALTTLHSFDSSDGVEPWHGLVQASDGNFYGTTEYGGTYGWGTVFKITPSGTLTTLHSFCAQTGCTDGAKPLAGLVQATDGNFYGTTTAAGTYNDGTVFKITLGGTLTTLHSFDGSDGFWPYDRLVQATDGNFYGTTSLGGTSYNDGTVFKITSGGTLTTLHSFCVEPNCTDGANPYAGLMQATNGNFYGTTYAGGTYNEGTVFSLSVGLTQFVELEPTSGSPGAPVTILGTNLTGSTSVTFNGTLATFTVVSPSEITTTVPAGATTGTVWVTTPSGVLSSNVPFQVTYALTVSISGDGAVTSTDGLINCPGTCSNSYPGNTQVTLNATPAQGWSFAGWSGACTGTGSCNLTITQNVSVAASFTQNAVTLTVSTSGNGSVTSTDGFINCPGTCSHTYLSNTQVTLNASSAQGWTFSGWSGACSGVGSCNITMTQDLAVTAVFLEPGHGLQFTPATPCRLVDTRNGNPIQGGTVESFIVPQLGGCGIPTSAAAYSLNVTVVPRGTLGYLTIWPTGEAQPYVSTMNSPDGRVKANAAIVPAGTNGAVSVYVTQTTDVIFDIDGYFAPPGSQTYAFYPLTPCRVVDTRRTDFPPGLGAPSFGNMEARELPVLANSPCLQGLPQQPQAYSFNVTVVPNPAGQSLNYLTIWPSDQPQPYVSTLNNPTATVVANAAILAAAGNPGGDVSVFTYNSTDVIIDVNGYFTGPPLENGLSFYPAAPCRAYDSRLNHGQPFQGERTVSIVGSVCAPPSSAQAYVFNATVVPSGFLDYLSLWPDGEREPVVSTLNAYDGFITSNMAIVPNVNGSIDAYASQLTQLILDISGYFAP